MTFSEHFLLDHNYIFCLLVCAAPIVGFAYAVISTLMRKKTESGQKISRTVDAEKGGATAACSDEKPTSAPAPPPVSQDSTRIVLQINQRQSRSPAPSSPNLSPDSPPINGMGLWIRPGWEKSATLCHRMVSRINKSLDALERQWEPSPHLLNLCELCLGELRKMYGGKIWNVEPFGSYTQGCFDTTSDLDVTLNHRTTCKTLTKQLSGTWRDRLTENDQFEMIDEVHGAAVPLIRLRFRGELKIDLTVNNLMPLQNSRLLRMYLDSSPSARRLCTFVKHWAKAARVRGSGNISSYSFVLMVIYFLQVHFECKLPVVPTKMAFCHSELRWKCPMSFPALLQEFFHFYANEFAWGTEVVSIRTGDRRTRQDKCYSALQGTHTERLHIEDPYELARNLHCVLLPECEERLRGAFRMGCEQLLQGRVCRLFGGTQSPNGSPRGGYPSHGPLSETLWECNQTYEWIRAFYGDHSCPPTLAEVRARFEGVHSKDTALEMLIKFHEVIDNAPDKHKPRPNAIAILEPPAPIPRVIQASG